jgi:hypothetical protein
VIVSTDPPKKKSSLGSDGCIRHIIRDFRDDIGCGFSERKQDFKNMPRTLKLIGAEVIVPQDTHSNNCVIELRLDLHSVKRQSKSKRRSWLTPDVWQARFYQTASCSWLSGLL